MSLNNKPSSNAFCMGCGTQHPDRSPEPIVPAPAKLCPACEVEWGAGLKKNQMPVTNDTDPAPPSIYTAEEDTFWMIPIMTMPRHYAESIWDLIQTLQPTYLREHGPGEHLYNQEEFSELTEIGGVTDEQAKLIDFISEKSKEAGYIRFDID